MVRKVLLKLATVFTYENERHRTPKKNKTTYQQTTAWIESL